MIAILAALLQAAGPGPLNEGWVFPSSLTQRVTAECPVIGTISAEFRRGRVGTRVIEVRGMGRRSNAADRRRIDEFLGGMQGLTELDVGCWGHVAGYIRVRGVFAPDGVPRETEIAFIWRRDGATALPPSTIYPSAP
ncbi:MAG TPA: hypothetical protein VEW04_11130 [Allosphingosinicella sp.]|nr:hypothetical protein [Allosphingosinicella sp.]